MTNRLLTLALALAAMAAPACLLAPSAIAQQSDDSELAGAPGSRAAEQQRAQARSAEQKRLEQKQAEQQAAEKKRLAQLVEQQKAEQKRLAQQAEAQKAEQKRLAQLAEQHRAEQKRLAEVEARLKAEEKRLEQLRVAQEKADQQEAEERQLAELNRPLVEDEAQPRPAPRQAQDDELESADVQVAAAHGRGSRDDDFGVSSRNVRASADDWRDDPRIDFVGAARSCSRAGEQEAWRRNYYSAEYLGGPRLFEDRRWQLFGRMRVEDRRGYFLVDTVCEIRPDGQAVRFEFLR